MKNSSPDLRKTKSTFNPWNDARMLKHVASNRTPDFAHLSKYDSHVMPRRSYNRKSADIKNENDYYNSVDRTSFDYLKANNSINTVHLQNPYRSPQRLEGFASRDQSKVGLTKSKKSFKFFVIIIHCCQLEYYNRIFIIQNRICVKNNLMEK